MDLGRELRTSPKAVLLTVSHSFPFPTLEGTFQISQKKKKLNIESAAGNSQIFSMSNLQLSLFSQNICIIRVKALIPQHINLD